MSQDVELALTSAMHEMRLKYIYFILTVTGASIGFAVTQTRDAELTEVMAPLGVAVVLWAVSFFCGCRSLYWKPVSLVHNVDLLQLRSGRHPIAGANPEHIRIGEQIITHHHDVASRRAAAHMRWQFSLFIGASIFFLIWHVLEMWVRQLPVT